MSVKDNENELMKRETAESLIGRTWNELSDNEQEMLTKRMAVAMDNVDDNGDCIIEFLYTPLSISGRFNDNFDENVADPFQNATIYSAFDLDDYYRKNERVNLGKEIVIKHMQDIDLNISISDDEPFPTDEELNAIIADRKDMYKVPIKSMELNFEGDSVDITCHLEPVLVERIRRITGYLVGDMSRFNDAKAAEVKDRKPHSLTNNMQSLSELKENTQQHTKTSLTEKISDCQQKADKQNAEQAQSQNQEQLKKRLENNR